MILRYRNGSVTRASYAVRTQCGGCGYRYNDPSTPGARVGRGHAASSRGHAGIKGAQKAVILYPEHQFERTYIRTYHVVSAGDARPI